MDEKYSAPAGLADEAVKEKAKEAGSQRLSFVIVFAWIAVASLAAYYNSFNNTFQLDDFHIAVENPWVHDLKYVPRYYVDPNTFSLVKSNIDYRPFLTTTYALNYAISKDRPWSWHALSLLFHALTCLSLFWLGRTLFGSGRVAPVRWLSEREGDALSFGAALLFAVHPVNSGVANYMSARSSLLVTMLVLPATALYLLVMHRRRGTGALALAAFLYVLALLSKVEAISLLGVLYVAELLLAPGRQEDASSHLADSEGAEVVDNAGPGKTSLIGQLLPTASGWRRLLPFVGLTVVYIIYRLILLPPGVNYAWGVPGIDRTTYLLTQFRAWWYYVGQLIAPVVMVADYGGYPESSTLLDPRVLYALAGWVLVAALLLYAARRAPAITFLGLAFFIHLSPHSSIMPISEMVNEHRPYLPTAGLFLIGMAGLFLLVRKLTWRTHLVFWAVVLILAVPLGAMTLERNKVWKDEESFWGDIVSKDPNAPRSQMNYGLVLMGRGEYPEAERRFREAVRLGPFYPHARINLGIVLAAQGKVEEARKEYDEAVRLAPQNGVPYYWRGLFLSRQGDVDGAIADLQKAVELSPTPVKELEALASNLIRAGRTQEAREVIERGSAIEPERFAPLREKLK